MNKPYILMCPPIHYGIEYEINPWMSTERQADHELANQQWQTLRKVLLDTALGFPKFRPSRGCPTWSLPPTRP